MYLAGFFLETHSVMLLPSVIALAASSPHLGWRHAPYPSRPLCSGLCLPPGLHSHGAPLDLGSHQTTGRFLNEVCDVQPLCLCTDWPLFENAFPLVHLANPIRPLRFLSGKPSCSARHVGSLLWANTVSTHLSVIGLFRLDRGL